MKTRLLVALVVALLLVSPAAYAGISGSAHDFSAETWNPGGELCEPCHIPHNAPEGQPLWNHALSAETFTTYGTTLSGQTAGQPGSASLQCLGCHDGVTNLDAFGGSTGTTPMGAVAANFGTDLSDDHPIGITPSVDVTIPSGWERNGGVECSSCHEPHDTTNDPFLRDTITASQICIDCHTTK